MACLPTKPFRWASFKAPVGLALFGILCGVSGYLLYETRQAVWRNAVQQQTNIALTLEHQIESTAATLDLSLRAAMQGLRTPGLATLAPAIQRAILFDGALDAADTAGVILTDEAGTILYSLRNERRVGSNISDQQYFQARRNDPNADLVVSGPVRSSIDGTWVMLFSRRITRPDGSFGGIAVAALNRDFFDRVFASLRLDERSVISIFTQQGQLVSRRPVVENEIGRNVQGGALYQQFLKEPSGTFEATARLDGVNRIYTYKKSANLPLIVAIGSATTDLYAGWQLRIELFVGVLVIVGGAYLMLGLAFRRETKERLRAEQEAVHARAQSEQLATELSRSLSRLQILFSNSADAMFVAVRDQRGEFVYEEVNPVWESLTNVCAAAAIGHSPRDCLAKHLAETVLAGWDACIRDERTVQYSFRSVSAEQEQHWDVLVCPVIEADGINRRLIGVARNVTKQNLLERQLRQAERMEAVGKLTAGMAHEFNNLLQVMFGALETAMDQPGLDDDAQSSIAIATTAMSRSATLIHQLIAFSGKQVLVAGIVSPAEIVGQLIPAIKPLLNESQFVSEISDDARPVLVDLDQLTRCLVGIVQNARDAMPEGGMLVLRAYPATPEGVSAAQLVRGDYTCFSVEDEGEGMPADILAHVFEPFFTTRKLGHGSGLGLPMVRGFARQSGGDVTIESAAGLGTTVTLWLPRGPDDTAGGNAAIAMGRLARPPTISAG